MRIFLAMLVIAAFSFACNGEAEEGEPFSNTPVIENVTPTLDPTTTVVPATPTAAPTPIITLAPTPAVVGEWANCKGITRESGDELFRAVAGEEFCIVWHEGIGYFVSIYDQNSADCLAQKAASFIKEPGAKVAYFLDPGLGITSFRVDPSACDK